MISVCKQAKNIKIGGPESALSLFLVSVRCSWLNLRDQKAAMPLSVVPTSPRPLKMRFNNAIFMRILIKFRLLVPNLFHRAIVGSAMLIHSYGSDRFLVRGGDWAAAALVVSGITFELCV